MSGTGAGLASSGSQPVQRVVYVRTRAQLACNPTFLCLGVATINLPPIADVTQYSSWARAVKWQFSVVNNVGTTTCRVNTNSSDTITVNNSNPAAFVNLSNNRTPHRFEYTRSRFRGAT